MIGKTLSQYHLVEKFGAGGLGEVCRAKGLRSEREVAIKVLPAGTLADEAAREEGIRVEESENALCNW